MQKLTHVAFGLFLARYFGLDPWLVFAGALLPDLDYAFEHRKLLHNIFFAALVFLLSFPVWVGVVSHLLLDLLTRAGVALLWPLSSRRFGLRLFRTGGLFDWMLFFVFSAALVQSVLAF